MASTIFSGNEVKTLKDVLSLNDKAKVIPVNADPTSGAGVAAPIGSLALDYSSGRIYRKTGSLATEWQSLGSGVGGINYIANPDAESGTTGWATYADAAGSAPVDGTGGTANITWSRSTSSPLRGIADFNLVKDAVNRQGQGVSYDFTIDPADLAKVLTVAFDYEIVSGAYSTGDLTVYLVQDPTGTPVIIQPAGYQIGAATVGTKMREIATFQTSSSATSYRLCIHVASTSASAYTLAIDNVQVGPQVVQYGAPVTDWQAYTPTITATTTNPTLGTNTTKAYWRRVGDSIQITYTLVQTSAGTAGSGTYLVSLPAGLSIDTNKIVTASSAGIGAAQTVVGSSQLSNTASANTLSAVNGVVSAYNSTNVMVETYSSSSGGQIMNAWGSVHYQFSATTLYVSFNAEIPVLGWSSTVQMSNDTDTRVVAVAVQKTANQAITANVTDITFDTKQFDTHSAWSGSAFIAPVPGYYSINGLAGITTAAQENFVAYVDGVARVILGTYNTNGGDNATLSGVVQLNAGQSLTIRGSVSLTVFGTSGALTTCLQIFRLSGPSAIAASETVAACYLNNAGTSIATVATTPIPFATKVYDTHGAFSTNVYTVPVAGKYRISVTMWTAPVNIGTGQSFAGYLDKNGAFFSWQEMIGNGASVSRNVILSTTVDCLAGDLLRVYAACSVATTLNATTGINRLAIERIGN